MYVSAIHPANLEQSCGFSEVPRELVANIFNRLWLGDLARSLCVCRAWFQIADVSTLWHQVWQERYGDQVPLPTGLAPGTLRRLLGVTSAAVLDFLDAIEGAASGLSCIDGCVYRRRCFYTAEHGTIIYCRSLCNGRIQEFEYPGCRVRELVVTGGYLYGIGCNHHIVRWNCDTGRVDAQFFALEAGAFAARGVSLVWAHGDQVIVAVEDINGTEYQYVDFGGTRGRSTILGSWVENWQVGWVTTDAAYILFDAGVVRWPLVNPEMGRKAWHRSIPKEGQGNSVLVVADGVVTIVRPDGSLHRLDARSLRPVGRRRRLSLQAPVQRLLPIKGNLLAVDITGRVFWIHPQAATTAEVCPQGYDPTKKCLDPALIEALVTQPGPPSNCWLF